MLFKSFIDVDGVEGGSELGRRGDGRKETKMIITARLYFI